MSEQQDLRVAVLPVAGLGTRFLPATKAMPKEMLTVVDRPLIQHVVDEAKEAGIEHFVFVTGRNKGVIEDHFDIQYELEDTLRRRNKTEALELLARDRLPAGAASFVRQQEPLGLGHAVWCAREIVGDRPFALLLPDMLVKNGGRSCLGQMADVFKRRGGNVIAVEPVPDDKTHQYGVIGGDRDTQSPREIAVQQMVEKPAAGTAPSNLIITGRYILQPEIFDLLSHQAAGAGGEIQITDSMVALMERQAFTALEYEGVSYDCGSKAGFLAANIAYAIDRPELHEELAQILGATDPFAGIAPR